MPTTRGETRTVKPLDVWPSIVTITALLLGLAGLLASSSSSPSGVQQTRLTCHVSADGTCR
jgi:hypothetical protein